MLCGHVQTATSQDILEILQRNAASTNKSTKKNGVQNYATAVVSAEIQYMLKQYPLSSIYFLWFIGTDQPKVLLILLQSVKLADGLVIVAQLMRIAL